ncbi:hypothetical protein COEREDRAFT_81900 [Coemansia reversa NRRL 1564]|uniref:Uncharacterized protein n=1 Tax=Coemansia reversa (strain ATCC 12441 / NRRL 1564) TaxID=763665 RepID=A0A2G5B9B7_COERN|nr:hypothetical protein COEREDRAFT_81900 [Coemansia reversa NRRL 1564]|eukprot:PIA15572.1 hypothetical protein COEREDRAFT_81900 [Coemansia reversa NRRL 1564]
MMRNLWLQSCVGFIPIANIVFTRKFKCNIRNLQILELQMQEEEDRIVFQNPDNLKEDVLPKHIAKMFNKCPVYRRPRTTPENSSVSSPVVSVYYSPCASLSELGVFNPDVAESIKSRQSIAVSTATTAIETPEQQMTGVITEKQLSILHARVAKIKST